MKRKTLILPLIATTVMSCTPLMSCNNPLHDVFETMADDYKAMLINCIDTSAYDQLTVEQIKALLDEVEVQIAGQTVTTYKFKDLVYESDDRAWWPPHQHLRRASVLAVLGAKKAEPQITNIALKLLQFWLGNDFKNSNWWFGMIGVPQELCNIGLFLMSQLNDAEKALLKEDYRQGTFKYNPQTLEQTGTNLFWCADISLRSGLFDKDQQQINKVVDLVKNEITMHYGDGEGFQDDGSYFHHGNQLYNGGYGRQGVLVICRILSAFTHQEMPLTNEQIDIIDSFPLDGMKYFTHKGYVNYQTMGRTYTRKESGLITGGSTDLGNILEFKTLGTFPYCPRKQELTDLLNRWENKTSTFNGIKYFPRSCMITMNIDDVYLSFRGTNPTLINTEMANSENYLGYNQSYGITTCVMSTGEEYYQISPVWNYSSIPGTTCMAEPDVILALYTNEQFKEPVIGDIFNGGYNKENNIAYSMQHGKKNYNNFTVTCFGTENGMVLLGAGLANDYGMHLHTTVEQCIVKNESVVTSPDLKSVTHGNVVYTNLDDSTTFDTQVNTVTHDWSRNNESQTGTATEKILKIEVDHPRGQTTYAYSIQPTTKQDKKFVVVANSTDNQVILLPNNKLAAAFYTKSQFTYQGTTYSGDPGEFQIIDIK